MRIALRRRYILSVPVPVHQDAADISLSQAKLMKFVQTNKYWLQYVISDFIFINNNLCM